ncbi:DUF924 family protein [Novosphingobium sp. 9]|uniref:DUF924 family protein n=1 Tax=Novosphingobium sp. 9 TaxID=2025349 RepID=UPI0021B64B18|nr:DUF924 family protein [Novosphingobium sp. 9]
MDSKAREVLDFWFRDVGPEQWFSGGENLDAMVAEQFADLLAEARGGALDHWAAMGPLSRLALILLLDQFPRHIHRGTAAAFASDEKALALALDGLDKGMEARLTLSQRHFFALPLMHAEDPQVQARALDRYTALHAETAQILAFAQAHADEIARFGRFPGRNTALGRETSEAEATFLATREG